MGIVCPHTKTKEDVEALVSYVKYPPRGIRGMAMTARAPGYTTGMGIEEYTGKSNEETMVIVQIEDREGVENFDAILKVPGLDAVFIGRNDLAMSMGAKGNVNTPKVQEAIEMVAAKTIAAGLPLMLATDEVEGVHWIRKGAKLLSVHFAPFVRRKVNEAAAIIHREKA
jgi:2-keto-3-deoxy-L-rhamnonate aldolase RhmA